VLIEDKASGQSLIQELLAANDLAGAVAEVGVRSYFQQRGYFKVVVHHPATKREESSNMVEATWRR
jgi:hypothetical protein